MKERGGDKKWSEKTVIEKMHMILGLGEYVEVRQRSLRQWGQCYTSGNKEWMKYRKVNL